MKPLAEILRPQNLSEFIGQNHLIGEKGPIKQALANGLVYSMVFWGPPGCGKTTLARIIAAELQTDFIEISPTTAGVKDIKQAVEHAKSKFFGSKSNTILFIDEIHRFNKAQQDYLLPHVENGTLILIGATTENPSFEIISPLLSRLRVYTFNPLELEDLRNLAQKALKHLNNKVKVTKDGLDFLVNIANGDARNLINAIEILSITGTKKATAAVINEVLQKNLNRYDKTGDEHYNTISAFIKSMRASDTDAALYYLARMIYAGEDPKFIARRMIAFSSEDIGMANSNALIIANEVFRAVETIGYPECRLSLAHGTIYMCKSPKIRKVYDAIEKALEDAETYKNIPVPLHLRNAPTALMKNLGYGKDYEKYPKNGSCMPKELKGRKYFV